MFSVLEPVFTCNTPLTLLNNWLCSSAIRGVLHDGLNLVRYRIISKISHELIIYTVECLLILRMCSILLTIQQWSVALRFGRCMIYPNEIQLVHLYVGRPLNIFYDSITPLEPMAVTDNTLMPLYFLFLLRSIFSGMLTRNPSFQSVSNCSSFQICRSLFQMMFRWSESHEIFIV